MQTTSATMLAALDAHETGGQSFDLVELVEVYAFDYQPDAAAGFEPADAEQRWCGVEGYLFTGLAYAREYVDRGDVQRYMDRREGNVTLNFSNVSRELALWVQSNDIEGKQVVLRVVSRATSAVLADSLVIFTGRLDKPGDFSDTAGSLTVTQRFGQLNQQFPPRTFSPNDPAGRAPNDPKFEGFRFTAQAATVLWTTRVRREGFGGLVGLTKKVTHSLQASSHTQATADLAVPDAFGRVQLYGTYLATIDIGGAINLVVAVCEGGDEGIDEFVAVKQINPKFSQLRGQRLRYGYPGGEGAGARAQVPIRQTNPGDNVPGDGYYSRLAFFHGFVTGSTPDVDEAEGPDWMILVKAKRVHVPDGAGVFSSRAWTDVPAYIARHLLADARYFNEGESAINDAVCYETGQYNAGFALDRTKGEWVFVPETDAALHGVEFFRFRSTGLIDARRVRMAELGTLAGDPAATLAEIEPFDPVDPPDPFDPPVNPNLRATVLRQRHTCNVTLLERMSGLDFLFNVVAPTGRLFFRRNGKGQIDILSEKPADNTRLRAAVAGGATSIPVTNVEPWKTGLLLTQRLLVGNGAEIAGVPSSEVRTVTAAAYTADGNSITLAAATSGGVTVTPSGATFSGGSSSVPASATVTLGGAAGAGVTLAVTINGISCAYTLDAFDSLASAALLLARFINATPRLAQFVRASAAGSVVTLTALWGVLTVTPALALAHAAEVASPTAAPTAAASAGGVLPAGTYYVAYARRTAYGPTALSPAVAVAVADDQKIVTGAVTPLPAGAASVDWYVSTYADSTELVYYGTNAGAAFTIGLTEMPDPSADLPPDMNTSGEELVRVAASFASNDQGAGVLAQTGLARGNIHKGKFRWPLPGKQSSTNMVAGTFYDATEDYAPTPLEVHDYAHQRRIRKVNKKEVDLSGFDNLSGALRYLNFVLSKHREGDWFDELSAGPQAMLLEEGDVYCASSDSGGLVNVVTRAEEISIGRAPQFTTRVVGRKYSTLMFSDNVRQHSIRLPTTLRHLTPLATEIQLIDIPFWREHDAELGPGVVVAIRRAAGLGNWKGATLWLDTGDGYREALALDVEAVTGEALTALDDHTPGLDATSAVRVRLDNTADALPFATDDELRAGANLFRLAGEIFQAGTCALVVGTEADYDLSNLRRGLFGTENETGAHATGDEFTVLARAFHLPVDARHVGSTIKVKAVTVNQDLTDAVEHTLLWTGKSQKPLAIARVELEEGTALAPRDVAGDVLIEVWPRSNFQGRGDEYRIDYLEDDGTEIPGAFELFKEGTPQPAMLESFVSLLAGKFDNVSASVSGNTFSHSGGIADMRARSMQKIRQADNFAEATLRGSGTNATVRFGLLGAGKNWRTAAAFDYHFRLSVTGGTATLEVFEGTTLLYSEDASAYAAAGKRFHFRLLGNKVQFFKDYVDDSTPPVAESVVVPSYPVAVVARITSISTGAGYCENVTMTTNPLPVTVLTAAQQAEWYGGLKSPVRVRIRQHSGVRQVGYGFPWEDEI